MFASVTRLRVRSLRYVPGFLWMTFLSQRQVVRAPEFVGGKLLIDARRTFWTLTAWGSERAGGEFDAPSGVATDGSGHVYVADGVAYGNDRIQKFDASGTFLTAWGSYGSGNGQFSNPIGVATDGSGNLYVADTNNNRIQKFTCP